MAALARPHTVARLNGSSGMTASSVFTIGANDNSDDDCDCLNGARHCHYVSASFVRRTEVSASWQMPCPMYGMNRIFQPKLKMSLNKELSRERVQKQSARSFLP